MNTRIINNWEPETKALLTALREAGCEITSCDNGEYRTKFVDGQSADFIVHLTACDEARLYVKTPDGKKQWLYLVLGNSPGELVCDYTCHPVLDAVTEAHYTSWSGRTQPTKTINY